MNNLDKDDKLEIIQGDRTSTSKILRTVPEPVKSPPEPRQPLRSSERQEKGSLLAEEPSSDPPKGAKNSKEKKEKAPSWRQLEVYSSVDGPGYIRRSPIQCWFNTFMIMNLPVIGWIYLLILALSKKDQRKDFARAYLVYKLVFFLVALGIIALLLYSSMDIADRLLQYINML